MLTDWNFLGDFNHVPPESYGSLDYSEAQGSGNVSSSRGNPGATRIFYVKWGVYPSFLDALQGYSTTAADGRTIQRVLPDPHPILANMWVEECMIEPLGVIVPSEGPPIGKYTLAKVTATYRSPSYKIEPDPIAYGLATRGGGEGNSEEPMGASYEMDRFVTRRYSFGGDYITVNASGLKFVSNFRETLNGVEHLAISQPQAKPIMTMEINMTWHQVPPNPRQFPGIQEIATPIAQAMQDGAISSYVPPNLTQVINCYGRLNSTTFDVNHINAPPGTVLFIGFEPEMRNYRVTTGGVTANIFWDIRMKFLYRNNGFITRGSTGTPTYLQEYAGHSFIWDPNGGLPPPTPKMAELTAGSPFLKLDSIAGRSLTEAVSGPGIPAGSSIISISGPPINQVALNNNATLTGKQTLTFGTANTQGWWDLITVDGKTLGARLNGPPADLNLLFTIG